jgi:hypothetical protein
MEVIAVTSDHICDDGTCPCHRREDFVMRLVSVLVLILHSQITFSVKNPYILSRAGDVTPTSREAIAELKYLTEVVIGPPLAILEVRLYLNSEESAPVRSNNSAPPAIGGV